MSSVRQIAAQLGLSVATVSRALNNLPNVDPKTRARVTEAASSSGYALPTGKRSAPVIGLAYTGVQGGLEYGGFDSQLLSGIMIATSEQSFDVQIITIRRSKRPDETYSQFFGSRGMRAVILRTTQESRHICNEIADEGFPAICIADRFDEPNVSFVWTDSKPEFRRAVDHLLDLGHRRIALGIHNVPDRDHNDRLEAFHEAFADRGMPVDPSLVMRFHADMQGGVGFVSRVMTTPEPPTALVLTNPLATFGALRRCLELGIRVPTDLSIVGFDDGDLRRHTFPVCTAVCQQASRLGFEAASWLIRLTSGQSRGKLRLVLPAQLEINTSTAPPRAAAFRLLPDGSRLGPEPVILARQADTPARPRRILKPKVLPSRRSTG